MRKPGRPAARIMDNVLLAFHPKPPILTGIGISKAGSPNVFIGKLPAWRGVSPIAAASLMSTKAAQGTNPAAMASAIAASSVGGADKHLCAWHGAGVVIDGSRTVFINKLPACRMGDTIIEPIDPPNKITRGCFSVLIGN